MAISSEDWMACDLVEVDPLRVGGRPVLKGTRMPVDDIVANYEYGVSIADIAEQFRIAPEIVERLLKFAERHQPVAYPA